MRAPKNASGSVSPNRPLDGPTSGRSDRRHAEECRAARSTSALVDVVQERAARVRVVRRVHGAAGELREDPGVDRSERELPGLGALPEPVDVREQPLDLRGAEVRVEHEPVRRADLAAPRLGARRIVRRCGGLARRSRGGRASGVARSQIDRRLALVGDPDRGEVARLHRAAPSASATAPSVASQIWSASCSTQPGLGKCCGNSRYPFATTRASSATTSAVTPVVPASIASTLDIGAKACPSTLRSATGIAACESVG